jgi:hypothetical protein
MTADEQFDAMIAAAGSGPRIDHEADCDRFVSGGRCTCGYAYSLPWMASLLVSVLLIPLMVIGVSVWVSWEIGRGVVERVRG